jgi:hypothetical protein
MRLSGPSRPSGPAPDPNPPVLSPPSFPPTPQGESTKWPPNTPRPPQKPPRARPNLSPWPATKAFKESVEKSIAAVSEINAQSKKNLEAVVASMTAAAKGAETVGARAVAYSKKSMEDQVAAAKSPVRRQELPGSRRTPDRPTPRRPSKAMWPRPASSESDDRLGEGEPSRRSTSASPPWSSASRPPARNSTPTSKVDSGTDTRPGRALAGPFPFVPERANSAADGRPPSPPGRPGPHAARARARRWPTTCRSCVVGLIHISGQVSVDAPRAA